MAQPGHAPCPPGRTETVTPSRLLQNLLKSNKIASDMRKLCMRRSVAGCPADSLLNAVHGCWCQTADTCAVTNGIKCHRTVYFCLQSYLMLVPSSPHAALQPPLIRLRCAVYLLCSRRSKLSSSRSRLATLNAGMQNAVDARRDQAHIGFRPNCEGM